jgi:regulator of sigma E protease
VEYLAVVPILWLLVVVHELGHFIVALVSGVVVHELAIGFPPRLCSVQVRGIRFALNLIPLGAYVRMEGEVDPTRAGSLAGKSCRVRVAVLAAGPLMNLVVALAAFSIAYGVGWPDSANAELEILQTEPNGPAMQAGVLSNDRIRQVEGQSIRNLADFRAVQDSAAGPSVTWTVERAGALVNLTVTPRPQVVEGQGRLGIQFAIRSLPTPHGPLESLVFGFQQLGEVAQLTLTAPWQVIRGNLGVEVLRPVGVPGMTHLVGEATGLLVDTGTAFPLLTIVGGLSAALGITNLLPLPALDGGRLLFVGVEALRRRRIDPQREARLHRVGLALLLLLMISVTALDLWLPAPHIDWGIR